LAGTGPTSGKATQNLAIFTEGVNEWSVSSAIVQANAPGWAQRCAAPVLTLVRTYGPTVATLVYAGSSRRWRL
jgi:hypothetical protein